MKKITKLFICTLIFLSFTVGLGNTCFAKIGLYDKEDHDYDIALLDTSINVSDSNIYSVTEKITVEHYDNEQLCKVIPLIYDGIKKSVINVKVENTSITKNVNVVVAAIKKVENPASYGTNPNAQAMADEDEKIFALPTGASYVTGTVNTGVVVNIKGSEFVWVPVDDVVLDTSRDADLPKSSDTGTSGGKGKTYTPMAVQVGNDYKGILYDFSGRKNSYLMYPSNSNYQGDSLDYREPDVASKYDGTSSDTVDGKITTTKLTTEYNAMIASVLKYKGFYVARYEAGLDKTTNEVVFKNASVEANNVTTADATNSETSSWYGLYKKIKTFTTDSDKVVSSMIWGSQYDAMMNWMAKTGKTVGKSDDTKRNTTTITGGGKKPDIINNIYDVVWANSAIIKDKMLTKLDYITIIRAFKTIDNKINK